LVDQDVIYKVPAKKVTILVSLIQLMVQTMVEALTTLSKEVTDMILKLVIS
jgi:hypothetical protein